MVEPSLTEAATTRSSFVSFRQVSAVRPVLRPADELGPALEETRVGRADDPRRGSQTLRRAQPQRRQRPLAPTGNTQRRRRRRRRRRRVGVVRLRRRRGRRRRPTDDDDDDDDDARGRRRATPHPPRGAFAVLRDHHPHRETDVGVVGGVVAVVVGGGGGGRGRVRSAGRVRTDQRVGVN